MSAQIAKITAIVESRFCIFQSASFPSLSATYVPSGGCLLLAKIRFSASWAENFDLHPLLKAIVRTP